MENQTEPIVAEIVSEDFGVNIIRDAAARTFNESHYSSVQLQSPEALLPDN